MKCTCQKKAYFKDQTGIYYCVECMNDMVDGSPRFLDCLIDLAQMNDNVLKKVRGRFISGTKKK